MTAYSTTDLLNRVLVVHHRSLPMYLIDASPWMRRGEKRERETLQQIARDHRQVVDRIGALVLDYNGQVELGEYPLAFTAYNDVAFDWLLPVLIERQQKMIQYLQQIANLLGLAPAAKAVVEETVGMAKAHLEMLQDLQQPAPANSNGQSVSVPTTQAAPAAH
jgi:hypothetical protein